MFFISICQNQGTYIHNYFTVLISVEIINIILRDNTIICAFLTYNTKIAVIYLSIFICHSVISVTVMHRQQHSLCSSAKKWEKLLLRHCIVCILFRANLHTTSFSLINPSKRHDHTVGYTIYYQDKQDMKMQRFKIQQKDEVR